MQVGKTVSGHAGCPALAHSKQRVSVGIMETTGITGYNSGFVGIFYRNIL